MNAAVFSVLYYLLGVLAPTIGAMHQCVRQAATAEEEATVCWIQYFLLLCTLHSVVFPTVLKPLSFVMPSWFTSLLQTGVVVALAIPKLGLTAKIHSWCINHYVEYLVVVANMFEYHVIKPLKKHANAFVDKIHSAEDTTETVRRRGEKEL